MEDIDRLRLPKHIAVIMDGNGRWAQRRLLNRIIGHREGVKAVRESVEICREVGIEYLTLFAFSSENWNRPEKEINELMKLLKEFVVSEVPEMLKNDIRLHAIGEIEKLPSDVIYEFDMAMEKTAHCRGMILTLALSYGGRGDITEGVRKVVKDVMEGRLCVEEIDEAKFSKYLSMSEIPDPDLLIRTSGEFRISNFFLWQLAYTEIYVTNKLWPDIKKRDIMKAIANFQDRERRYGMTSEQVSH
ncbi:MAG: isoprenyl transferase [Thermodesulfobacteriota bacterium]|nr:isoprenyl transferase [Thermodesulfobacteriota bacterium]